MKSYRAEKRVLQRTAALILCLLAAACQSVTADRPVGSAPLALDAEDWEGTWEIPGEDTVKARVVDAAAGTVEFAGIEPGDDGFTLEKHVMHLRTEGDWIFASIAEEGTEGKTRYVWGRIANKGGLAVIVWPPSFEGFRRAVEAGKLTAEVSEDNVHLVGLTADHLRFIVSEDPWPLFDWDEPVVLIRVDR